MIQNYLILTIKRLGAKIKLKSLGKNRSYKTTLNPTTGYFNVQPQYNVDTIELQDASGPTYEVVTKDFHRIRLNDVITVQTANDYFNWYLQCN